MAQLAPMPDDDSIELTPHPQTPAADLRLVARARREAGDRLALSFIARGGNLVLPAPAPRQRADELWRTTCFEAFVAAKAGEAYLEINLSPSGRWALYAFDAYREGMRSPPVPPPEFDVVRSPDGCDLTARVDLAGLASSGPWRLALTAVTERLDGAKSYWSLAHPAGKPDFHHSAGFVLTL
jgi:hypothetical protein